MTIDNANIEQEIWNAIETGVEPTKEMKLYLSEFFDNFSIELQNKLVDLDYVKQQRCEVWSRVMGYFRPVDQFNVGKKQEFKMRNRLYIGKHDGKDK